MFSKLWQYRRLISVKLYFALAGSTLITFFASMVAFVYFNIIEESQRSVNDESVPQLQSAFVIAQQSGAISAALPRLTSASSNEELERIVADIKVADETFNLQLAKLTESQDDQRIGAIGQIGDAVKKNIDEVQALVVDRFEINHKQTQFLSELNQLQDDVNTKLVPRIDDQLFYAMTGYRTLDEERADPADWSSDIEFEKYRHLREIQALANESVQLLSSVFNVSNADLIEPQLEKFEASLGSIDRHLRMVDAEQSMDVLKGYLAELNVLGFGLDSSFKIREQTLLLVKQQQELVQQNREMVNELVARVEEEVQEASDKTDIATQESTAAIDMGQTILVVVNIMSISGAILIAWLFVGRTLVNRLAQLSAGMQQMAGGNLEIAVNVEGQDEVAEMARALEIFRKNALEVQRLNLVEKLANELQDKNLQLEHANEELKTAQDQIIMREKLAALGELTAGVAHEIKNPLNFIINFSEASQELIEELLEELDPENEEKDMDLVAEIGEDLTGNLERIRGHGNRANDIVRDMLAMGRDSNERSGVDVNRMLTEHLALAFHSARANDDTFQLTMNEEYDSTIGEIQGVAQDLGRLFLNLFTNACYATNARRLLCEEKSEAYVPTLDIKTTRLETDVEIRVRDNGTGIPAEAVEKIFNPFFTTKPTDEGTGLGLALTSDIVRSHGGKIRVETAEGEFTEMIVTIPIAGVVTE